MSWRLPLGIMAGRGGATAFNPLSAITWYAYYDAATTFAATPDATAVDSWADLSGNTRTLTQVTGTKQPTVQTVSGKKTVRFDGGDGLATSAFNPNTAEMNVFLVGNSTVAGTDQAFLETSANFNSNDGSWILYRMSTNRIQAGVNPTGAAVSSFTDADGASALKVWDSTYRMAHAYFDVLGTNKCTVYRDGMIFGSRTNNGGASGVIDNEILYMGSRANTSLYLTGDIQFAAMCGALTAAQRWSMQSYLARRFNLPSQDGIIVFEGDSLTYGQIVAGRTPTPYPDQVISSLTGKYAWDNYGVSGQTVAQMELDHTTQILPNYNASAPKNVCVLWGGTNDMGTAGGANSAATTYSRLLDYGGKLRAAGFQVIALTCLPRSDANAPADFETKRQALNTSIRAGYTNWADVLCDVAADTRIGDDNDELDTTYYTTDLVHLNATGYGVVAGLVKTALATLGVT